MHSGPARILSERDSYVYTHKKKHTKLCVYYLYDAYI